MCKCAPHTVFSSKSGCTARKAALICRPIVNTVESVMTFVVTEACIKCKYTDCVEVCPVDCFYEGENMLVINPDECIDCGVCEPECPIDAILPDTDSKAEQWLEVNRIYSDTARENAWPNITVKKDPMPSAEEMKDIPGKMQGHFSDKPGEGD